MKTNSWQTDSFSKNSSVATDDEEKADDLAEYLESLTRTTPTTLPEWMD